MGVGKVAIIACCAALLAATTVGLFVRTSVKGVVGTEQDSTTKAQRWDFATQWSLPKIETLRVIVPGLFGYRMDTPDGGNYWGRVGEAPSAPKMMPRSSGAGEYTGVLVVLIAAFGVADSLRKKGHGWSDLERRLIWAWAIMALVALLLSWGRHAPFYRIIYALPYFSTIRNPMKFMHAFNLCVMVLFAYGLTGLHRSYLGAEARPTSVVAHLGSWWRSGRGFEKSWTWGCILFLGLSAIGWIAFSGSHTGIVEYLINAGFPDREMANSIARFSGREILLYVVVLALSIAMLTLIVSGALSGRRATVAILGLGVILTLDLARADAPWIIYYEWKPRYAENPVLDVLRNRAIEHRVTMPPFQAGQQFGMLQNFYHSEWLQHQFPYYGIQSIDMPQEPRVPADKQAYREALGQNLARLWQLTNTRYVFGMAGGFADALNSQLDPEKKRFTTHTLFTLFQKPGTQAIGAEISTNGPFALYEFGGALPRAKLYTNWEIISDEKALLARLGNAAWDPLQTVLISDSDAPKPATTAAETPGAAEIVANPSTKRVDVKTTSTGAAMLLFNDKIEPEWRAYIDDKPTKIYRANYLVRGVHVPAGQHVVQFRYEMKPSGFYLVLGCEIVGLLLLAVIVVSARRSTARGTPTSAVSQPSA